jgi:RimJ/RimL family protein N-acetyltransferase
MRDDAGVHLEPAYPVRTARLRMRPLTDADADAMVAYRGRPDVCRDLPFEPMTRDRVLERLARDLSATAISDEDQALTLGVELASTGTLIGDVVLFFRSRLHRAGELGYVFAPEAGGQGYATEACTAMLGLAFDELGLHRVTARLDARNDSSARMAARLGMRLEAHFVRSEMFKGEWSDELVYAMLADEWAERQRPA